jgi:hypothetical protein
MKGFFGAAIGGRKLDFCIRKRMMEPTPGFEPGTFSLPSGLQSLANSIDLTHDDEFRGKTIYPTIHRDGVNQVAQDPHGLQPR